MSGTHQPYTELLLNSKASKKIAQDAALRRQRHHRQGVQSPSRIEGDERRDPEPAPGPGPVLQSVLPLRRLFAEHLESVAERPVLLHNMPTYYAVLADVLQTALEDTELHLRTRTMTVPPSDDPPM